MYIEVTLASLDGIDLSHLEEIGQASFGSNMRFICWEASLT